MKKRIVALALLLILVLTLACGCKPEYKMKIGIILAGDENTPFYNDFIQASKQMRVGFELRDGLVYLEKNVSADEVEGRIANLVDEGCKLVVAVDSSDNIFEDSMVAAAKKHGDIDFYTVGGKRAHLEKLKNYHAVYAAIHDGKYLTGIAAGIKLREMIADGTITADQAKVGYVATRSGDEMSAFNAFYLGVRAECESAVMDVYYAEDDTQGEAAQLLIDRGCKIIAQNTSDTDVIEVCANNGVYNIGHGISMAQQYPDTFIVSTQFNWTEFFYQIYGYKDSGFKVDRDWVGIFKYDVVQYSDVNFKVASLDTAIRLDQMKAELLSGTRHVFDTSKFTVDTALEQNKNAKTDQNGYLTGCGVDLGYDYLIEVVENGYFNECTERSYPYFNLIIDGITIVD